MDSDEPPRPDPGYDETTQAYHVYHDGSESVCTTVITAVAAVAGLDPTDLSTPFNDRIDPDALNDIFTGLNETPSPADEYVTFVVAGYGVRVYGDGHIVIDLPSE